MNERAQRKHNRNRLDNAVREVKQEEDVVENLQSSTPSSASIHQVIDSVAQGDHSADSIVRLQRAIGNHALQRLLQSQDHNQEISQSSTNHQPFPWLGASPSSRSEVVQRRNTENSQNNQELASLDISQTGSQMIQLWPANEGNVGVHPPAWAPWFRCHDAVLYWLLADAMGVNVAQRIIPRIVQVVPGSPQRAGQVLGAANAPRARQGQVQVGDILFFGYNAMPNHSVYVSQVAPLQVTGFNGGTAFGGPVLQYTTDNIQNDLVVDPATQNLSFTDRNAPNAPPIPLYRIDETTARGNIAAFMNGNNIGVD